MYVLWNGIKVAPSPGTPGPLRHLGPSTPPGTLGSPGTSGNQDHWEISFYLWTSEPKYPETLKLKQKQKPP